MDSCTSIQAIPAIELGEHRLLTRIALVLQRPFHFVTEPLPMQQGSICWKVAQLALRFFLSIPILLAALVTLLPALAGRVLGFIDRESIGWCDVSTKKDPLLTTHCQTIGFVSGIDKTRISDSVKKLQEELNQYKLYIAGYSNDLDQNLVRLHLQRQDMAERSKSSPPMKLSPTTAGKIADAILGLKREKLLPNEQETLLSEFANNMKNGQIYLTISSHLVTISGNCIIPVLEPS